MLPNLSALRPEPCGAAPKLFVPKNECPVCFAPLFCFEEPCEGAAAPSEPFGLPCGHVLCMACARRIVEPDGSCRCPVCRESFASVEGLEPPPQPAPQPVAQDAEMEEPREPRAPAPPADNPDELDEPAHGRAPEGALWDALLRGRSFGDQQLPEGMRYLNASDHAALFAQEVNRTDFLSPDRVGALLARLLGLRDLDTGRFDLAFFEPEIDRWSEGWRRGLHSRLVGFRCNADFDELSQGGRRLDEALAELLQEASAQIPGAAQATAFLSGFFVCWGSEPGNRDGSPEYNSRAWYQTRANEQPYTQVDLYLALELQPRDRDYSCLFLRDPFGYYGDYGGVYGARPERRPAIVLLPAWRKPDGPDFRQNAETDPPRAIMPFSDREGIYCFAESVVVLQNLPRAKAIEVVGAELVGSLSLAGVESLSLSFGSCTGTFHHSQNLRELQIVQSSAVHAHNRAEQGIIDREGREALVDTRENFLAAVWMEFVPDLRAEHLRLRVKPISSPDPRGPERPQLSASIVALDAQLRRGWAIAPGAYPEPLHAPGTRAVRSESLPKLRIGSGIQEPRSRVLYEHRVVHDLLRAFQTANHVELVEDNLAEVDGLYDLQRSISDDFVEVLAVHTLNLHTYTAGLGALFRGGGLDSAVQHQLSDLRGPTLKCFMNGFQHAELRLLALEEFQPERESQLELRGSELTSLRVLHGAGVRALLVADAVLKRLVLEGIQLREVRLPRAQLSTLIVQNAPKLERVTQPGPVAEWDLRVFRAEGAPRFNGLKPDERLGWDART